MLFDYGIYLSKKTNVCLFNTKFIVTFRNNMTKSDLTLKIKDDHEIIHEYVMKDNEHKEIKTCIFRTPTNLLKRRNNRYKENIKAFITFKSKGNINFKDFLDSKNLKVQKIINRDTSEWKCLLKKDVNLFIYLSKYLKIDAYKNFELYSEEYEVYRNKKNIQELIKIFSNRENVILDSESKRKYIYDLFKHKSNLYIALMTHLDFCVFKNHKSVISKMDQEYKRMLEYILLKNNDGKISSIDIDHPFYHEINLFNNFIENEFLDPFQFPLTTINERGIKYFIFQHKNYKKN